MEHSMQHKSNERIVLRRDVENMTYTVGDEVRYALTGQFGIVKEVDEINQVYAVDIDGTEYTMSENELN